MGVAVIDSGVTSWHDDLTANGASQRVHHFVDFVNDVTTAYDDYGHGTHVAGIIAGNGLDSGGARSGIAPAAHLIVLKVLDEAGRGHISDVIAALDYVVANKDALNIRVVNLSIATGVYESYDTDPLTLAAKRAVEAGIVVVAAAGNHGRYQDGSDAYGGITAPGNAPWVLTVGASNHAGSADRADDTFAAFSSRGPTADRPLRQTGRRRAWRRNRVAERSGECVLHDEVGVFIERHRADVVSALFEPQRNEHGRSGRERHGCADAAGESSAHTQSGEGDPSVHGAALSGLRRAE